MNAAKDKRDILSVDDAILSMKVYNWSPKKIILLAEIGNLRFDVASFLFKIKFSQKEVG